MVIQPGRSEKRISAAVSVALTSSESAFPIKTELTKAENISGRGARVNTDRLWSVNGSLVIKSLEGDLQSEARVIYCQRVRKNGFAIGLELIAPAGNWQGE